MDSNSVLTDADRWIQLAWTRAHKAQRFFGHSTVYTPCGRCGWSDLPELERVPEALDSNYPVRRCELCGQLPVTRAQVKRIDRVPDSPQEQDWTIYTHEAQAAHGTVLCQHREEHPISALYITQKSRSESLGLVYSCGARDRGECLEQRERFAEMGPAVRMY